MSGVALLCLAAWHIGTGEICGRTVLCSIREELSPGYYWTLVGIELIGGILLLVAGLVKRKKSPDEYLEG